MGFHETLGASHIFGCKDLYESLLLTHQTLLFISHQLHDTVNHVHNGTQLNMTHHQRVEPESVEDFQFSFIIKFSDYSFQFTTKDEHECLQHPAVLK